MSRNSVLNHTLGRRGLLWGHAWRGNTKHQCKVMSAMELPHLCDAAARELEAAGFLV